MPYPQPDPQISPRRPHVSGIQAWKLESGMNIWDPILHLDNQKLLHGNPSSRVPSTKILAMCGSLGPQFSLLTPKTSSMELQILREISIKT